MKKIFTSIILSIFCINYIQAQLTTSQVLTPQQLVQNVLLGTGVTASNITYTGITATRGTFNGTSSNIGLPSGVLLSVGKNSNATGPNDDGSISVNNNLLGDPDLDDIMFPTQSYDATILEFDFVPTSDTIKFRYVFASEEYMEYVSSTPGGINDGFGFFVSGPGISGPFLNNAKNIAIIPGTTLPVTMYNLNLNNNSSFYFDNGDGQGSGTAPDGATVQYDGFSIPLTAATAVQCGQTYHIKIAIGDGGDGVIDSGVFLEEGSFSSIPPISISLSNIQDTVMTEDCNTNCIYFVRKTNISQADSFKLQIAGNAILGSDYAQQGNSTFNWPSQLMFAANQDTIAFCDIKAINDQLTESTDTLKFTITSYITNTLSCVSSNSVTFNLYIRDYKPIIIGQKDSIICNGTSASISANASFGVPAYTYTWTSPAVYTPIFNTGTITQPTIFTVTVNDICNKPVTKQILITPSILPAIQTINPYKFCLDSIGKIPVNVTGGKLPLMYNWYYPFGGLIPYDTINHTYYLIQSITPSNGTYSVVVQDQCNITDTVQFDITTVDCKILVPNVVTANNDNVNDYFKIHGLENYSGSVLSVYNRWGTEIYKNTDYKNDWKPSINSGTYFYLLAISDGRTFNGFFQVFKD